MRRTRHPQSLPRGGPRRGPQHHSPSSERRRRRESSDDTRGRPAGQRGPAVTAWKPGAPAHHQQHPPTTRTPPNQRRDGREAAADRQHHSSAPPRQDHHHTTIKNTQGATPHQQHHKRLDRTTSAEAPTGTHGVEVSCINITNDGPGPLRRGSGCAQARHRDRPLASRDPGITGSDSKVAN